MPTYPKDFFDQWDSPIDEGLCFVIMPFAPEFDEVWEAVRAVAENDPINIRCLRADDVTRPGVVMEDVLEHLAKSRLVVADLTDRNPNVFYEVGIAHSFKSASAVVLLTSSIDDVPFDLRHLRCIVYGDDLLGLRGQLAAALSEVLGRRYCVQLAEGERARFPNRMIGADRCFYEVEVRADFMAEDGVKVFHRLTRLVGGRDPEVGEEVGPNLLDRHEPLLGLEDIPWVLEYGGYNAGRTTVYLRKRVDQSSEDI